MSYYINGIQQIGVGNPDMKKTWKWYKENFGVDVRVFEEAAVAELMLPYTGNQPRKRHAALAINMQGGGGFEIWQYTERIPEPPKFDVLLGDLGINIAKIKCKDVEKLYANYKTKGIVSDNNPKNDPIGNSNFFVRDNNNNIFQLTPGLDWFKNENKLTGGVLGAIIGVSDIEKALKLYSGILGYNKIIYDKTGVFEDFKSLPGGEYEFRRILLTHTSKKKGAFSPIFGTTVIELIQVLNREPQKIFKDRLWGDMGYIHLCFDINGMAELRKACKQNGFPFTVDTGDTFDMGEASGAFAYIEDPDGTLIEFVETHKVPIMKKLNWYLDLRKRNQQKPLPRFMLNAMGLNRAKDI